VKTLGEIVNGALCGSDKSALGAILLSKDDFKGAER